MESDIELELSLERDEPTPSPFDIHSDHRMKWLADRIRTLFDITDDTCCERFFTAHHVSLSNYFEADASTADLKNQLLFIWLAIHNEIVNELITVLEPGAYHFFFIW